MKPVTKWPLFNKRFWSQREKRMLLLQTLKFKERRALANFFKKYKSLRRLVREVKDKGFFAKNIVSNYGYVVVITICYYY